MGFPTCTMEASLMDKWLSLLTLSCIHLYVIWDLSKRDFQLVRWRIHWWISDYHAPPEQDKTTFKLFVQEVLDWIAAESSGDHTIEIVTDNMLDQVIGIPDDMLDQMVLLLILVLWDCHRWYVRSLGFCCCCWHCWHHSKMSTSRTNHF